MANIASFAQISCFHHVALVIIRQHNFKHVCEERSLKLVLRQSAALLDIAVFIHAVRHYLSDDFSPKRNQRHSVHHMSYVFEVPECSLRDLHMARYPVARQSWLELVQLALQHYLILAAKQVI